MTCRLRDRNRRPIRGGYVHTGFHLLRRRHYNARFLIARTIFIFVLILLKILKFSYPDTLMAYWRTNESFFDQRPQARLILEIEHIAGPPLLTNCLLLVRTTEYARKASRSRGRRADARCCIFSSSWIGTCLFAPAIPASQG